MRGSDYRGELDEAQHAGVGKGVGDVATDLLGGDQAAVGKAGQMVPNPGTRRVAECLQQVRHGRRPVGKTTQDGEPGRVAENPEQPSRRSVAARHVTASNRGGGSQGRGRHIGNSTQQVSLSQVWRLRTAEAPTTSARDGAMPSRSTKAKSYIVFCYRPPYRRFLDRQAPLNDRFTQDVMDMAVSGIQPTPVHLASLISAAMIPSGVHARSERSVNGIASLR